MAKIVADRVLETSTTTGTGAYTLAGAISGFRAFSAVCANADTAEYYAEDVNASGMPAGGWEVGLGTWGTGGVLTRTTIYQSSNAGAAVSWSAGTRRIGLVVPAKSLPYLDNTGNLILSQGALREKTGTITANNIDLSTGNYFAQTISGSTTFTVSNTAASGTISSFIFDLTNGGSAAITWWSGVKWAGGTAPTLTAAGRDVLGFFTRDGGTTWTGLVLGKDVK